jgi:CDP-diacylglycerol--glycerol-3-phosphate 3-phosphatidyltransferase
MSDAEFARAFEAGQIPHSAFHHVDHLRVAWVFLAESPGLDAATARMRAALQRFAAAAGHSEKYSDAVTIFWMERVAAARTAHGTADFAALLRACPHLLDKDLDASSTHPVDSPGNTPGRAVSGRPA